MRDKIKPTFVLSVICMAAALLLVLAYEVTKESIAAQQADKFSASVEALFGECEYTLLDTNFGRDEIDSIAVTENSETAFKITVDG